MKIAINKIIINDRFRKELGNIDELAESIKTEGLLQPIGIDEKNVLIFGMRRLLAVKKLGWSEIDARVVNVSSMLEGERTENEMRKQFTIDERIAIAESIEELIKAEAKERQKEYHGNQYDKKESGLVDTFPQVQNIGEKTRDIIAKKTGFGSGKTYEKAKLVSKSASPEVKQKLNTGDLSINQAYKQTKLEIKKQDKEYHEPVMPSGKYRVIYADPPWKYNDVCTDGSVQSGGAEYHYPTMTITELCEMPLPDIEDNAVLFLWVTSPLLEDAFKVIKAWGFKYKASFIWDKVKHNMGHYNSVRHELLLICTKGSCTPDNVKLYDSVQSIERKAHSQKPEEFRNIIDTIYTRGERIELFARKKVKNWECYGNESTVSESK